MSDNQSSGEVAFDRREKIVKTAQPGYQSTQQVTEDAAGSRRLQLIQITRFMLLVLGVLEIMLGLRFILKLMAANPVNGFAGFIYGLTGTFTGPFDALLGPPAIEGSIFETTTLIAMAVYAMLFGLAGRLLLLIGDRPRARTSAQAVQTQITDYPAAISVDRIDRADPQTRVNTRSTIAGGPEIINVEQTPPEAGLDSTDRRTLAESINVEQPPTENPARADDLLQSHSEFVQRHRRSTGSREPKIPPDNMN